MLLKLTITVWPILDLNPVSPDPCHTHTHAHTQKSRALCSVAAEVQMVCLYASLTQGCSFTSSLLRLLLLDSELHLSHPSLLCTFVLSSSSFPFFGLPVCCLSPSGPRSRVLMNEYSCCIVLSHPRPCFDNGSFDSFPTRVQLMAETESWKPCSYQKEHVTGEAIKPTSG